MTKRIIVNKFGGGILKKELIPFIEKRLEEQVKKGYSPVVVVSALPKITDTLLAFLAKTKNTKNTHSIENFTENLFSQHLQTLAGINCTKECFQKTEAELRKLFQSLQKDLRDFARKPSDKLGEKFSATIFANYFDSINLPAKRFLAEEIPIITDDNFKNANIFYERSKKNALKTFSNLKDMPVIPGFTGLTKDGHAISLGRGGTDTTACFIGSALKAEKIILWKDVGGVMSADPKIVPQAKTIPFISYQEAEEAGKIIHDKAIKYAKLSKTQVEIASLADPKIKTIVGAAPKNLKKGAKIVSFKKDLILFLITDETLKGNELLSILSDALIKNKVDVILISNTRYSIQIVADNSQGLALKVFEELKNKIAKIEINPVNMVFLVGNFGVQDVNDFNTLLIKMKTDLEISAFLYKNCTRLEAVVRSDKIEKIINALHKKFIK